MRDFDMNLEEVGDCCWDQGGGREKEGLIMSEEVKDRGTWVVVEQNSLLRRILETLIDNNTQSRNKRSADQEMTNKHSICHNQPVKSDGTTNRGFKNITNTHTNPRIQRHPNNKPKNLTHKQPHSESFYTRQPTNFLEKGVLRDIGEKLKAEQVTLLNNLPGELGSLREQLGQHKCTATSTTEQMMHLGSHNQKLQRKNQGYQELMPNIDSDIKAREGKYLSNQKKLLLKQKHLSRLEASLHAKQQILLEESRRVQLKFHLIQQQQHKLEQERHEVDFWWSQILSSLAESPTFTPQIFQRCRLSLLQQRQSLLDQEHCLSRSHTRLTTILQQLSQLKL